MNASFFPPWGKWFFHRLLPLFFKCKKDCFGFIAKEIIGRCARVTDFLYYIIIIVTINSQEAQVRKSLREEKVSACNEVWFLRCFFIRLSDIIPLEYGKYARKIISLIRIKLLSKNCCAP